jgi:D-alanyl-D-alanine carboxypeptidase
MNLQEIIHRLETIYQQTDYNGSYALVTADKILAKKNYGFAKFKEKGISKSGKKATTGISKFNLPCS